jgi:hypothetical protein
VRRRLVRLGVGVAVGTVSLSSVLASAAWAPKITFGPPPTVPANKDECKDGGWQGLGWPNQGQCVASTVPEEKKK